MTLQESLQLSTQDPVSSLSRMKSTNFFSYHQVFVTCTSLTKKRHANHKNILCNVFPLSKGNISSISLWLNSRLFVRNLQWWNKLSLDYQIWSWKLRTVGMIEKEVFSEEKKNRKRLSPVLQEELWARYNVGCVTSRSVGVCESD